LACYGKAMGNGYPIGAIVGPERFMRYADRVSSTFGGELVGLAAAGAAMGVYTSQPVIKQIWDTGQALKDALNLDGYPCYPRFKTFTRENATKLAANGVLIHPAKGTFVPTFSHCQSDVDATVKALNEK